MHQWMQSIKQFQIWLYHRLITCSLNESVPFLTQTVPIPWSSESSHHHHCSLYSWQSGVDILSYSNKSSIFQQCRTPKQFTHPEMVLIMSKLGIHVFKMQFHIIWSSSRRQLSVPRNSRQKSPRSFLPPWKGLLNFRAVIGRFFYGLAAHSGDFPVPI